MWGPIFRNQIAFYVVILKYKLPDQTNV